MRVSLDRAIRGPYDRTSPADSVVTESALPADERREIAMSVEPQGRFLVVVNAEEQYSIWDSRRKVPVGWTATGFEGSEAACLDHIDAIWTDMRPLSLREKDAHA